MRQIPPLFVAFAIGACTPAAVRNPNITPVPAFFGDSASRIPILMLGTYHFSDPGQDAYKPKFKVDFTSPERAAEIADVVNRLRCFRPTHVAVEAGAQNQGSLDSAYRAYRAGKLKLPTNEVYQLGFRLAAALDLPRVDAVDAEGQRLLTDEAAMARVRALHLNLDSLMRSIQTDSTKARFRRLYELEDSLKTVQTLREHLLYTNQPERIRIGNGDYLTGGFRFGRNADYIGVDDATQWYNRNLRIFSNLQALVTKPEDRILLIIGAGHLPILRFLAESSVEVRNVEPNTYLNSSCRSGRAMSGPTFQ